MNTDEVSATDFMDALQHGTIVAMELAPMELTLSAQLGYCWLHFSFFWFKRNNISQIKSIFFFNWRESKERQFFFYLDI